MPIDSSGFVALVVLDTKEAKICAVIARRQSTVGPFLGVPGHREGWTHKTRTSYSQKTERDPMVPKFRSNQTPCATRLFNSSHRRSCEENEHDRDQSLWCLHRQATNNKFISSHRKSCGRNTLANILLDAYVEDEEEGDDPGVVRQPRHASSHSSFPSPAYLQLNSVHMAFFSASEAVARGPPWHAESTMLQSTRCCTFKGDRVPVSMNSCTFEEARGRRRHHETHSPWVFTGIAASCDDEPGSLEENPWSKNAQTRPKLHLVLDSHKWLADVLIEFSSTSGHSRNCWAQYPKPSSTSTTAVFLVNSCHCQHFV